MVRTVKEEEEEIARLKRKKLLTQMADPRTIIPKYQSFGNATPSPIANYGTEWMDKNKPNCHMRIANGPGECQRCWLLRPFIWHDCQTRPSVFQDADSGMQTEYRKKKSRVGE